MHSIGIESYLFNNYGIYMEYTIGFVGAGKYNMNIDGNKISIWTCVCGLLKLGVFMIIKIYFFLIAGILFTLSFHYCDSPVNIQPTPIPTTTPTPTNISIISNNSHRITPAIAVSDNKVYIIYFDGDQGQFKFTRSDDYGNTWKSIKIIDSNAEINNISSSIALSGNTVYISYFDGNQNYLKFIRSDDNGDTWDTIKIVDPDNVGAYTSMAVFNNIIYISYYDYINFELKIARSDDNGDTWNTIKIVDLGKVRDIASISCIK